MKKKYKFILIIISFLFLIFGLGYITRLVSDLKEINIKENIIVSLVGKSGLFLINLNTEKIESFSGSYNKVEKVNLDINTKIYSTNNEFYFKNSGVFNKKNELLIRSWLYPDYRTQGFWTSDSKYLIRIDGHVVRLFGMFFSTSTLEQVIHIIEPITKKSKQILLYDNDGKLLQIERIEGYIK